MLKSFNSFLTKTNEVILFYVVKIFWVIFFVSFSKNLMKILLFSIKYCVFFFCHYNWNDFTLNNKKFYIIIWSCYLEWKYCNIHRTQIKEKEGFNFVYILVGIKIKLFFSVSYCRMNNFSKTTLHIVILLSKPEYI